MIPTSSIDKRRLYRLGKKNMRGKNPRSMAKTSKQKKAKPLDDTKESDDRQFITPKMVYTQFADRLQVTEKIRLMGRKRRLEQIATRAIPLSLICRNSGSHSETWKEYIQ